MKRLHQLFVNGETVEVVSDTRDMLLDVLRDRIGLTGTKEGCGNGNCGACTVLLDGEPVNACLVLAAEVTDQAVVTIEGLAGPGALHAVQKAIVEWGGTQCGFCTPGIVMSAAALVKREPRASEDDIRRALAGNLCRCTGYDKIVKAVAAALGTTG
jgi:aerobic carbon-monoxide dehydrogenase small subunit